MVVVGAAVVVVVVVLVVVVGGQAISAQVLPKYQLPPAAAQALQVIKVHPVSGKQHAPTTSSCPGGHSPPQHSDSEQGLPCNQTPETAKQSA